MHNSIPSPSWEYFTTLEYEWSVIRGRRPYRWTIWVGRYTHFLVSSVTSGPQTDLFVRCSIDLLPCAGVRSLDRSTRIYTP